MKLYVGIDPGYRGAIVALNENGGIEFAHVAPVLGIGSKTTYDISLMNEYVSMIPPATSSRGEAVVVIEKVSVRPKEAPSGALATGLGSGLWRGMLIAAHVPFVEITPATWQKRMLEGMAGEGKERAILACMKLLPALSLRPGKMKNPHDGLADAGLMALYAKGYGNR